MYLLRDAACIEAFRVLKRRHVGDVKLPCSHRPTSASSMAKWRTECSSWSWEPGSQSQEASLDSEPVQAKIIFKTEPALGPPTPISHRSCSINDFQCEARAA